MRGKTEARRHTERRARQEQKRPAFIQADFARRRAALRRERSEM